MSLSADVVVVGAGPAGSSAAREAARAGMSVVLLDRTSFPRTKPCGGGLSPRAEALLGSAGLWERVVPGSYRISGMRLTSPDGRAALIRGEASAWVLDRSTLDERLVRAAEDEGVRFLDSTRVDGLTGSRGRVTGVRVGSGRIPARWVVIANGAGSRFNPDPRPRQILHTCMARFEDVAVTEGVLEMVYDPALAPHYGWLFPESATRVNIGICLRTENLRGRSIRDVFRGFLGRHYEARLARATQLGRWRGHPICTTSVIDHAAPPGILVAGEANRLVNPATGEGISYAIESGILAARTIALAESRGLDPADAGRMYRARLLLSMQRSFLGSRLFCEIGPGVLNTMTRLSGSRMAGALTGSAFVGL